MAGDQCLELVILSLPLALQFLVVLLRRIYVPNQSDK